MMIWAPGLVVESGRLISTREVLPALTLASSAITRLSDNIMIPMPQTVISKELSTTCIIKSPDDTGYEVLQFSIGVQGNRNKEQGQPL